MSLVSARNPGILTLEGIPEDRVRGVEGQLEALGWQTPVVERLQSIPGIGLLTGAACAGRVERPSRVSNMVAERMRLSGVSEKSAAQQSDSPPNGKKGPLERFNPSRCLPSGGNFVVFLRGERVSCGARIHIGNSG